MSVKEPMKAVTKEARRLTQAERTEISDSRMLDAAVSLIVEQGPAGTSLKEVGMLAGYSRGLAGQRFGSKDALFAFVLTFVRFGFAPGPPARSPLDLSPLGFSFVALSPFPAALPPLAGFSPLPPLS